MMVPDQGLTKFDGSLSDRFRQWSIILPTGACFTAIGYAGATTSNHVSLVQLGLRGLQFSIPSSCSWHSLPAQAGHLGELGRVGV